MDYPDGAYLLVINEYPSSTRVTPPIKYICYVRNKYRSVGLPVDTLIKETFLEWRPYKSVRDTPENYQLTFIGSWDLITGMSILIPDMSVKELLQTLNINHES